MVEILDYVNVIVFASGTIMAVVAAYYQIKKHIKDSKEEQRVWITDEINKSGTSVVTQVKDNLRVIDERFRLTETAHKENKEDIEDVEDDIKQMDKDLKDICSKLAKHDYVIDSVLPEYKRLKEDFNIFKQSVHANLLNKKISYEEGGNSTDKGNRQNINRGNIED
jgi:hypothetical protein